MRISLILLLTSLVLNSCTDKKAKISGTIVFKGQTISDSLKIHLSDSWRSDDTLKVHNQKDSSFKFSVDPGKYSVVINSKSTGLTNIPLVVFDRNQNIQLDIQITTFNQETKVNVKGFEQTEQIKELMVFFEKYSFFQFMPLSRGFEKLDQNEINAHQILLNHQLDSLKTEYPLFEQYIIEWQLNSNDFINPTTYSNLTLKVQKADSTAWLRYYQNDEYYKHFLFMKSLLERIDPYSALLSGSFSSEALSLQKALDFNPELSSDLQIEPDYFIEFLKSFEKLTPSSECGGNILLELGDYYNKKNSDLALNYYHELLEKYPQNSNVRAGFVADRIRSLEVLPGIDAPLFSLCTTNGDTVSLTDYKDKFVFLDFWGTWCAGCKMEIPNIKNVYTSISKDTLEIIGIARDSNEALEKFQKEKRIKYQNVIATKSVERDYGIISYPTTFLISPEGVIIAKNLRGKKLLEQIRTEIFNYNQNKK
jgi:peroxiredoxin